MEHQNHSNGNPAPNHQTFTSSAATPSFRVSVDMGTEQYANGRVVYTSQEDVDKTCIDSLKDDAHYRFACRCGCGAEFAGYGKDIKAAAKVGREFNPVPVITTTTGSDSSFTINSVVSTVDSTGDLVLDDATLEGVEIRTKREEAAEKTRPYVSDRYLKKALYECSDDEIDAYQAENPDALELKGVDLSKRQPPAIGDLVYSLATGEGPYSVLEYVHQEVKVDGVGSTRVLCALVRTSTGRLKSIPLADLAHHQRKMPELVSRSWIWSGLASVAAAMVGSGIALALYWL